MHLPSRFLYPFIKLGARLYGKFNIEETSPYECDQKAKLPIIFFHGGNDSLVPCDMSIRLYNALTAYYTSPSSSNLFYALQTILKNKITILKTDSIKKECEISREVLKFLEERKDAETIISHIEAKYQSSHNARGEDVIQKNNIIVKLSHSEERRLLDEYVKKCDAELNVKYIIIYKQCYNEG